VQAELARDAAGPPDFPDDELPEVAVLGRSNVGKSSFINALLGRKGLARTSGRPGKTRRIHFYRVEKALHLVDLPGYGYAAVSKGERRSWRSMAESYLRASRRPLVGAILLVDLRRGPEEEEMDLLAWLAAEQIPTGVCFTKSDKLARSKVGAALKRFAAEAGLPTERIEAVSSKDRRGLPAVAGWIRDWTGFALRRADGQPLG
jgi:GTP-binding protein